MAQYPMPQRWSEMSTDYKLMFAFHGCMMILFVVGGALSVNLELAIAAALVGLATFVSILRRRQVGWRWQGVGIKEVVFALVGVVLVVLLLAAATPLASPSNPRMLPWFLAGAGIGLFGLLATLKLVRHSEAEFLADCTDQQKHEAITDKDEAGWKRLLRWTYSALFWAFG